MELEHRFEVPVGIESAWPSLLDMSQVAQCFPGATLTSSDGDTYSGSVKVKLGPIQLTYQGKARIVEADESAHRAVIEASGAASRSASTASMTVTATATPLTEDRTAVDMLTSLTITGRPAQFGRGVMVEVGNKILGQFADCLSSTLATGTAAGSGAGTSAQGGPDSGAADGSGAGAVGGGTGSGAGDGSRTGAADGGGGSGAGDGGSGASGAEAGGGGTGSGAGDGGPGASGAEAGGGGTRTGAGGGEGATADGGPGDGRTSGGAGGTGALADADEVEPGDRSAQRGAAQTSAAGSSASADPGPPAAHAGTTVTKVAPGDRPGTTDAGSSDAGPRHAAANYTRSPEPIDLLGSAGPSIVKRVVPLILAVIALIVLRSILKRRSRTVD